MVTVVTELIKEVSMRIFIKVRKSIKPTVIVFVSMVQDRWVPCSFVSQDDMRK
jgi:hypothetical protein